MSRTPAEHHRIARDALRATGLDVPENATPDELCALATDLLNDPKDIA